MPEMPNEQQEAAEMCRSPPPNSCSAKDLVPGRDGLIGPMPETPRGNKYIITLTDYFSKWAEAAPLPDKTAVGVANFIYSVSHYYNLYTSATVLF